MNRFEVLLLSMMVGGLLAGNCEKEHSDAELDPNLISNAYLNAVTSVRTPIIENTDVVSIGKFANAYDKAVGEFGLANNRNIYNQAKKKGDELIDAVRQDMKDFRRSIKSLKKNWTEEKRLNEVLKRLTSRLQEFLSWQPGNVSIERWALPDYPKQQTEMKSRTTYLSGTDIFVNLAETYDQDISSLFGYIEAIYLTGWRSMRPTINIVQEQFREQILNGPVMEACRLATDEVLEQSNFVWNHVEKRTWESFRNVGYRVVKISDDYKSSGNDKNC